MPYREAKTATPRGQIKPKFVKRVVRFVDDFQCLVVSANRRRGDVLARAAATGGWRPLVSVDADSALTCLSRSVVQLAVVDLEESPAEFRDLIREIAARTGLLLIVCGNEGSIDEEIWVRQNGAWLYLPGAVTGEKFAQLCGESLQIAQRLSHPGNVTQAR
jgi:DNA-binding NtrC family response regulator